MDKLPNKLIFFFLAVILVASCQFDRSDDDGAEVKVVNKDIYDLMKSYYLWNNSLPNINPYAYANPYDLMDTLRYSKYDRWSCVLTKTEYESYFEEGVMVGHGIMTAEDQNHNIRIAFVYRNTRAYNAGVRRSWIISKVNGVTANADNITDLLGAMKEGVTNQFEFINTLGNTVDLSLAKEVLNITPVVYYEVIPYGNKKIGYMVFEDFIDVANEELNEAFTSFNQAGIDEMVVDLRYNGGGSVSVADTLAGWLIGKSNSGEPFVHFIHNELQQKKDNTMNIPENRHGLNLSRIFFIGTKSTASASEMVINGVKPYLDETIIVGSATHGKPVGMYTFYLNKYNYVVLPICFKYTNANNEGDFYNGLPATISAEDDLAHDFGNPEEACFKAVLAYIETGVLPSKAARLPVEQKLIVKSTSPINQFLKAY
jgi:carboxyl-terminal processing protease